MLNIKKIITPSLLLFLFFVSNTTAQKINKMDANGKRTGIWKKYYDNGSIRYSGEFLNGKEKGVFKFYKNHAAYFPHIIKEFSAVSDTAYVKFFNKKQQVKSKGKMIGKKREGEWLYFFGNKKILSKEFYRNGKLDGLLKNYYPNGKVTNETYYVKGLKHGNSKTYTDDGILIEDVNYAKGLLDGQANFFDLKGVIQEKGRFIGGKRDGKWEFYIDGEISEKRKRNKRISNKKK